MVNLGTALAQHVHPKYLSNAIAENIATQPEFLHLVTENCYSQGYKRIILKWFIDAVEKANLELDGEVAAEYAMALCAIPGGSGRGGDLGNETVDVVYKTITQGVEVKTRETPWVIANHGSTGQRTWEAALCLGDYLLKIEAPNCRNFGDIVELGSGTGFVGILVSQLMGYQSNNRVILSDGDEQVVEALAENLALNKCGPNSSARQIYWGKHSVTDITDGVFLCADVTYDKDLIGALMSCLHELLSTGKCRYGLLSATMRSLDTFAEFERKCTEFGVQMELVEKYTSPFHTCSFFCSTGKPRCVRVQALQPP